MITEAILNLVFFIPNLLIEALPDIGLTIPDNLLVLATDILYYVGFIFPIPLLLPILIVSLALDSFKILMALFVRIKSFIPTMGA